MSKTQTERGTRRVDRETVMALARAAGLSLSEERVAVMLELLSAHTDFLNQVDRELKLGFQVDDTFHFVPPAYSLRNPKP